MRTKLECEDFFDDKDCEKPWPDESHPIGYNPDTLVSFHYRHVRFIVSKSFEIEREDWDGRDYKIYAVSAKNGESRLCAITRVQAADRLPNGSSYNFRNEYFLIGDMSNSLDEIRLYLEEDLTDGFNELRDIRDGFNH